MVCGPNGPGTTVVVGVGDGGLVVSVGEVVVVSGGLVDETGYLADLEEIAQSGITPAERLLEAYHGPWQGDVSKVFEALAY